MTITAEQAKFLHEYLTMRIDLLRKHGFTEEELQSITLSDLREIDRTMDGRGTE